MGRSWSIKPTVPQVDAKLVVLDPHILARPGKFLSLACFSSINVLIEEPTPPVVRDVDGDGVDDLLVAVSYYLSPYMFSSSAHPFAWLVLIVTLFQR